MSGVPGSDTAARNTLSGQTAQTTLGQPTPTCIMRGHTGAVWASAFFKDGRRVVTGSRDHTLQIWDVDKGASIGGPFEGHENCVRSVTISPDDKRIASGGDDQTIIIWDVETKQKVFSPLVKHTGRVQSVCFSPNGKRLASGSNDFKVVIWDAETGAVLSTLNGHSYDVYSVAFSPDGLKLASGSLDRTIRVWRTDNAELLLQIAHQDGVRSVMWSPDGQQLVSASNDATINFWNSSNGYRIDQPCIGHTDTIYSLAISSDGTFIATASADNTARLWNTKSHQQLGQALKHTTARVYCVAISPNGALLVSGDYSAKVRVWSIKPILEQHKAQEKIRVVGEARRLLSRSDTQLRSHDNDEPTGDIDITSNQSSGSDDKHSLSSDILAMNTMVLNASIAWDPHTAEEVLTQQINADDNNYDLYANRSVVRARNAEWDNALQDAVKSIAIQPSLLGYISKGIALCGNDQLWDAMEVFDLAFLFSNRDQVTIDLLLLIKAVALFNVSRHDEAMRRVQDLAITHRHSDTLRLCSVVNVSVMANPIGFLIFERPRQMYLHVQLAIIAFEDGRYSEAADRLDDNVSSITDLFSRRTFFEPRMMIFTVLFGWDLDSLWQTIHQRRCDAFLRSGRVVEAVESIQYMMSMIDDAAKECCLEWSTGECIRVLDDLNLDTTVWSFSLQERMHCALCLKGRRGYCCK
ncbi:WD40-repeat-containing domain protein [Suillus placidus]|uniref:WD40-repeat-containing domain protein n=1 Tax=Suillus placidus TaxID=48579 RepID=A0A9P7CYX5_9AGAM|nr:WD40-repeat-containing domain protein [Suillus placidus]